MMIVAKLERSNLFIKNSSPSCDASNRLSRESSQDILVEDLDRLSTTSAMSESSVSHRLNDVQDVQDIARMQEESLKHSTPMKNERSDTISPLSEQSLSSPVEEGGGYQSEVRELQRERRVVTLFCVQESCGSESGVVRQTGPRRGEVGPRLGGYSSQDSLPDSPYSSQSLDSHASQGGPGAGQSNQRYSSPPGLEVRRSMPNLNKLRGGKVGQGQSSQYGLSQAKYHNSESRLQNPQSRLAGKKDLILSTKTNPHSRTRLQTTHRRQDSPPSQLRAGQARDGVRSEAARREEDEWHRPASGSTETNLQAPAAGILHEVCWLVSW